MSWFISAEKTKIIKSSSYNCHIRKNDEWMASDIILTKNESSLVPTKIKAQIL